MSLSLIEELELQVIALRDNSLTNCALWVQRAIDALESQAREIEWLNREAKNDAIAYKAVIERQNELRAELAALKAQPSGVVLADDIRAACQNAVEVFGEEPNSAQCREVAEYMREVLLARLNQPASGGDDATVKQSLTVEPVAYAAFADNGNIRMWCRSAIDMCELFDEHGNKAVPLYAHPAALPVREAVAEGWQLVPVEPTPDMVKAAEEAYMPFGDMDIALRCAMLAAPSPSREGE